ncbi:MAG: hypothetical protein V1725_00135 [archaeon]
MPPPFMPAGFLLEAAYTLIILLLCFLVFFKTREIYLLTKYKGIQFFRFAFLFFGLAYASRLLLYIMLVGDLFIVEHVRGPGFVLPISNLVVAYFSTMAILYLTYGPIHKKISVEQFLTWANIISLIVAIVAFISISPLLLSLIQSVLLGIMLVINTRVKGKKQSRDEKRTNTRTIYFLLALFWLISLFDIRSPRQFIPFEVSIALHVASLGIFFFIYYKVAKWVK